jgi:hypothetical protein
MAHLYRLKASVVFSLQNFILVVKKRNNLYLGLVMPSSGGWSPIKCFETGIVFTTLHFLRNL